MDGQKLNTPNDLAIDRRGRIWFTNPWNAGNIDPSEVEELDNRSVLRADPQPDGSYTVTRVTFDTTMPNGVLVSPDQRTIYVAESNSERMDLNRELRAYPINEDGSLGAYVTLHSFGRDSDSRSNAVPNSVHRGIDGMCLDAEGNIVATAGWELGGPGPMIYVFLAHRPGAGNPPHRLQPSHQLLLRRPRPDHPLRNLHRRPLLPGRDGPGGLGDLPVKRGHSLTPTLSPKEREQHHPSPSGRGAGGEGNHGKKRRTELADKV